MFTLNTIQNIQTNYVTKEKQFENGKVRGTFSNHRAYKDSVTHEPRTGCISSSPPLQAPSQCDSQGSLLLLPTFIAVLFDSADPDARRAV
jgi:hypothetical protein